MSRIIEHGPRIIASASNSRISLPDSDPCLTPLLPSPFSPHSRARSRRTATRFSATLAASLTALCVFLASSVTDAHAQTVFTLPTANVASSTTATVPVTVQSTGSGTLAFLKVLTQGAPSLDFTSTGTTCTLGPISAGATCSVSVQFTPRYPGQRLGAIVLVDSAGATIATHYLTGTGTGPLAVMEIGELTTVAGNGYLVTEGNPVLAIDASINNPQGTAVDGAGNLYYSDSGNNLIRKVDPTGHLTTIAGTGVAGFSPNGTLATAAQVDSPTSLVLDGAGNLFFSDNGNNAVRMLEASSGKIYTVAGNGTQGYTGDGGAATSAQLYSPEGLALDAAGNLYIADSLNNVIREVTIADHKIATIAGTGVAGYLGDTGPATAAQLNTPWGVFVAPTGVLYIADFTNNVVRTVTGGTINTIVGTGATGYSGDNGTPRAAVLNRPTAVALDAAGDLFIADSENNAIRKVNATTNTIITMAGNGVPGYSGDGLDANVSSAQLNKTYSVTLDGAGDVYIAERLGVRIREVIATAASIQFDPIKVTNTSSPIVQAIENDGNAALTINSITPVSNAAFDTGTTTCTAGLLLVVGSTCNVGVEFAPTVVGSPVTGDLSVNSNSANSPGSIHPFGNSLSIFPTTTSVVAAPNPAALNTAVVLTATVSVTGTNTTALSGNISFYDGTTLLGEQPIGSGQAASLTTAFTTLGTHNITATYAGDTNDASSTSTPAFPEVVEQGTVSSLVSSANPSTVYQPVTFTVTVAPGVSGGPAPTGGVIFSSNGAAISGSIPLVSGVASFTTSLLAAGTRTITAAYSGDSNNIGSTASLSQKILLAAVSNVLTTSNPSVLVTTPLAFTAVVTGTSTGATASTPTGNVVFRDGSTVLGTLPLNSSGVATLSISTLAAGTHTIAATYAGDSDFGTTSSNPVSETITKITTTSSLISSANPSIAGSTIAFSINVTALSPTTPNVPLTGTVTLTDDNTNTVLGTGSLTAAGANPAIGVVVISTAKLTPGAHAITASYAGSSDYLAATSHTALQVNLAQSSTKLTASPTTVVAGRQLVLTATSTSNGGVPSGNVTFTEGNTPLGTGILNNGTATLTLTTLPVGSHTITATYAGDTDDSASSSTVSITVIEATTATVLTASQNPLLTLSPVVLTATVSGNGGTPTGSVTFSEDGAVVGTGLLNTSGVATLSLPSLAAGKHSFVGTYGGDAIDFTSASAPLAETVQLRATTDELTSSATSLTGGQQLTLISIVQWTGPVAPTGTVTFLSGTTTLGSAAVNGDGVATFTVLLSGTSANLTAVYSGDASYSGSTSSITPVTIVNGPTFTVTATPPTISMASKEHTTLNITLTSLNNFTDTFAMGCLGLPYGATCTFSQNTSVTLAAGKTQSLSVVVDTGDPLGAGAQVSRNHQPGHSGSNVLACFVPGCFLAGLLGLRVRRFRKLGTLLMLLCLAAASSALTGCGAITMQGTPAGTYHFQVNAVGASGISNTATITMTITQ